MEQMLVRLLPYRPRHSHLVPVPDKHEQHTVVVSRLRPRMECARNCPVRHTASHDKDIRYNCSRCGLQRVGHCDVHNGPPARLPGLRGHGTERWTRPGSLTPVAAVSATVTPPQCTKTPEATSFTAQCRARCPACNESRDTGRVPDREHTAFPHHTTRSRSL